MLEDLEVKKDKIYVGDKIRRDNMFLTFKGFDMDAGVMSFDLENAESKLNNNLNVSIKYWKSNQYYNKWHSKPYNNFQISGAYDFSPFEGQKHALPYTKLKYGTISLGSEG